MKEEKDPCWKGYEMVGMKKKGKRTVPNCVPANEEALDELKKSTVARYEKKAGKQLDTLVGKAKDPYLSDLSPKERKTANKRADGLRMAMNRLDEISMKTKLSYLNKSDKQANPEGKQGSFKNPLSQRKQWNRHAGRLRAMNPDSAKDHDLYQYQDDRRKRNGEPTLSEISAELVGKVHNKRLEKNQAPSRTLSNAVKKKWLESQVGRVKKDKKDLKEGQAQPFPDKDAVLAAFRKKETGSYEGKYDSDLAKSTKGKMSASGAYQFINKTWQGETKSLGVGTQYKRAVDAPKEVQDDVMYRKLKRDYDKYGSMEKAVNIHYTGNPGGKLSAKAAAANHGQNANKYYSDFSKNMSDYSSYKAKQTPANDTQVAKAPETTTTASVTPKAPETKVSDVATPQWKAPETPKPTQVASNPGDDASSFVKKQLKVAEETTMDTKEIISEAIMNIMEGNLAEMKDAFQTVLAEKRNEKLEERKAIIASNYFGQKED